MASGEVKTQTSDIVGDSVVIQMILDRMERTEDLIEKVAESQTDTNTKFTAFLEKFTHTEGRVDKLEESIKGQTGRLSALEKMNIRFVAYVISGFLIVTTLTGIGSWWYINVYKPQQQSALTTKSAIDAIDTLNTTNQKILEALHGSD